MNVPANELRKGSILVLVALFLVGCDSRASRAEKALSKYQSAAAVGDLRAERVALQELVAADEDVPSYWAELGKLQYQMRDLSGAYYSFTRANELNHDDADILRYLTQIALQSGALDEADNHAKELDLVAPGDPIVKITGGLISLKRNDFDSALRQADAILVGAPNEPNARVLKARALVGLNRGPEAIALLEQQVAQQPRDPMSLKALINLQRRDEAWPKVVALGRQYRTVAPGDFDVGLMTIEAAFRSNDIASARSLSADLLKSDTPPQRVAALLGLWQTYWPGPDARDLAARLALAASPDQKIVFADYLVRAGAADAALRLVSPIAQLPPAPETLDARAVYFAAMARLGRTSEAREGLADVIRRDPENDLALAATAPLLVQLGDRTGALNAARKLVTVDPNGVDARLTLVSCYEAAGDRENARRTLWDAFHEIPGAERIYKPLRAYLRADAEATQRLDSEFAAQRQRKIVQDAV